MAVEKNEKKPMEKLKKTVFFQAFKTLPVHDCLFKNTEIKLVALQFMNVFTDLFLIFAERKTENKTNVVFK